MNNFSVCLINYEDKNDIDVYNTLNQLIKHFNVNYYVVLNHNLDRSVIEKIERLTEYFDIQNKIINDNNITNAVNQVLESIDTDYLMFISSGTYVTLSRDRTQVMQTKDRTSVLDQDIYLLRYKSGNYYHHLPHMVKTSYLLNNQNNISYLGSRYLYISIKNNPKYNLLDNFIFSANYLLNNTKDIYDNFRTVVDLVSHGDNQIIDLDNISDSTIKFYIEYYLAGDNIKDLLSKYNRWELYLKLSDQARQSRNMLLCYEYSMKAYKLYLDQQPGFNIPVFNYDIYDNLVISCYYLDKFHESIFFSRKLLDNLDPTEYDRVNNNINLCLDRVKQEKNLLIINQDNLDHDFLFVISQIYNTYHVKTDNHDIGEYDISDLDYLLNNYNFDIVLSINYLGYLFDNNIQTKILLIDNNQQDLYLYENIKCNFDMIKLDMLITSDFVLQNYDITGKIFNLHTSSDVYDLLQDNKIIMRYKNNLDNLSYELELLNYDNLIKSFDINLYNYKLNIYTDLVNKILDNNQKDNKLDLTVVIHHVGEDQDKLIRTINSLQDSYNNILCFTDNNKISHDNIKITHVKNLTLSKLFNLVLDTLDNYILYIPSGTIFTRKLNIKLDHDFIRLNKNIHIKNFCNPMVINLEELRRSGYFVNNLKYYQDYFDNQEFFYNKLDTYYLQDHIDISHNYDNMINMNIIIRDNNEILDYKNIFKSHDLNINQVNLDNKLYVTDRLKHLFWYNNYYYRVDQMSYYIKNIDIWGSNPDYAIVIFKKINEISPDFEYELDKLLEYNNQDATVVQLNSNKLEYSYYLNKKACRVLSIISNASGIKTSFIDLIKNIPGLKYHVIDLFEHEQDQDQDQVLELPGYNFYSNLDSYQYDILYVENKTVQELKELCDSDDRYLGFNTLGWVKYHILPVENLNILYGSRDHRDGLYVKDLSKKLDDIKKSVLDKKSDNQLTFTITTCKRLDKFITTMNNFLIKCKDLELIDYFICIDDNSSDEDRKIMEQEYPFFEFILKNQEQKGHAQSMNILFDKIKTPYVIHYEDDWLTYEPFSIKPYLDIIKDKKLDQIMLRKNCWADHEFLEQVQDKIVYKQVYNHDHVIKPQINREHDTNYPDIKTDHGYTDKFWWWPGFTLNPSVYAFDILKEKVGYFNEKIKPELFEYDYALRAYKINYQVGYVNLQINHIGNDVSSYTLNNTKRYYDK